MEFVIRGRQKDGRSVPVASTGSAIKAKALRDTANSPWSEIMVSGPDGRLSREELDLLAEQEERQVQDKDS